MCHGRGGGGVPPSNENYIKNRNLHFFIENIGTPTYFWIVRLNL